MATIKQMECDKCGLLIPSLDQQSCKVQINGFEYDFCSACKQKLADLTTGLHGKGTVIPITVIQPASPWPPMEIGPTGPGPTWPTYPNPNVRWHDGQQHFYLTTTSPSTT